MRKLLFGFLLFGFAQLHAQDAMKISEKTFKFLSSQNSVKFQSQASMNHDYDSVHITENFTYKVKIKDQEKITFSWSDGMKRRLLNYNGKELTFFSLDDSFYSKYDVKGDLDELKEFVNDTLDYDFPFIALFSKKGFEPIKEAKPDSYYVGTKTFKGKRVHHLVFKTENFAWQMFISADDTRPVPYKIVVNDLEGKTQFTCEFLDWDFSNISDVEFERSIGDFTEIKQDR